MTKNNTGWTKERRAAQAARCRKNKPWKKATGPKTKAGKNAARFNALKSGLYSKEIQATLKALNVNADYLTLLEEQIKAKRHKQKNFTL